MKKSNATAAALLTFAAWMTAQMPAANAATTVYRDVGLFLAAVGPTAEVITFNGSPAGTTDVMGNYFSDTVSVGACQIPGNSCSGLYNYFARWKDDALVSSGENTFSSLVFWQAQTTNAIAFDIGGNTKDVSLSLSRQALGQQFEYTFSGETGFFGLIDDAAFEILQLGKSNGSEHFQTSLFVDNLYITTAVPERATMSLTGLGMLGLGVYLRLCKRRKPTQPLVIAHVGHIADAGGPRRLSSHRMALEERIQDSRAACHHALGYAPRSTLNSLNNLAGSGVSSFQTTLMGRSPSADSKVTRPQAR